MDLQMGNVRRMMHKATRKAERLWNRMANKVEKKLDL